MGVLSFGGSAMLRGEIRTKERKIIAAIMGVAVIIAVMIIYTRYQDNKRFHEQAVMAENYLKAGSYEEAIEAYKKALSMDDQDQELLTIGLAEAYASIYDFDSALEVLRTCYQKTSGYQVKEKIEEIITVKTDYEYSQSISRAEVFYNNKDYEKAIDVFEEAKQIKSKEATAYQRIAEAYIEMSEYEKAREEILEGQIITKDLSLSLLLTDVDSHIKKEDYNLLLKQASEYIYQENYEDGVAKFKEAIELLPKASEAYLQLAQFYMNQKGYELAILLLQEAVTQNDSKELQSLLKQARQYQKLEEEKTSILSGLYKAFEDRDLSEIRNMMTQDIFQKEIVKTKPVFYPMEEGNYSEAPILVIYDADTVYYGNLISGRRHGNGIYFMLTEDKNNIRIYYYDGQWKADVPQGAGKTVEISVKNGKTDEAITHKTVTKGNFTDGKEDGKMKKYFYINGEETGRVSYTAKMGVPKPLANDLFLTVPTPGVSRYIIGILTKPEEADTEYYRVEPDTVWGVKSFLTK